MKNTLKFILIFSSFAVATLRTEESVCRFMQPIFLLDILEKLKSGENIIFTKYGDGEYYCVVGHPTATCNIDKDEYHPWLGDKLKTSFINLTKKKNVYLGKWHEWAPEVSNFWNKIATDNGTRVPWVTYHLVMNDDEFLAYDYMYQFVEYLINTHRKKIVICNSMNKKLAIMVRAHVYIEIPPKNWSYQYEKWKTELKKHIEKDCIILISGGLCSKVLIDDITNEYDVTFIDLGSSFDMLTRGNNTRGWKHTYSQELQYYKNLLPMGW